MTELYDVQQFIDQRDPYKESLVLTINAVRDRERPGLRGSLSRAADIVCGQRERDIPGLNGGGEAEHRPGLKVILAAAGLASAFGAAVLGRKMLQDVLAGLVDRYGGWPEAKPV